VAYALRARPPTNLPDQYIAYGEYGLASWMPVRGGFDPQRRYPALRAGFIFATEIGKLLDASNMNLWSFTALLLYVDSLFKVETKLSAIELS
jgi:uncharacterized membrane protein YbhN (UPF0104 family)